MGLPDRFWQKVDQTDTCWIWVAATSNGYGQIKLGGRIQYAHRLSYEDASGPIPEGLVIDHLCRTPSCVNPDHLEAVTPRVNTLRGEALGAIAVRTNSCRRGHDYTPANTYEPPGRPGERECRECRRRRKRTYNATPRGCPHCGRSVIAGNLRRHIQAMHLDAA